MWLFTSKSESQDQRVLQMLIVRDRKAYEFSRAGILCYTKAISNLRKKGHKIEITKELNRDKDGRYTSLHTSYSLT